MEKFDKHNKNHINIIIEDIIEDIERKIKFVFQKYCNVYHQLIVNISGEENISLNWGTVFEYGTTVSPKVCKRFLSRFTF